MACVVILDKCYAPTALNLFKLEFKNSVILIGKEEKGSPVKAPAPCICTGLVKERYVQVVTSQEFQSLET